MAQDSDLLAMPKQRADILEVQNQELGSFLLPGSSLDLVHLCTRFTWPQAQHSRPVLTDPAWDNQSSDATYCTGEGNPAVSQKRRMQPVF